MADARYRRAAGPAAFTAMYMLASAVDAVVRGNSEFIFYIFVMLVLIALVTWMYRSVAFSAGPLTLCALAALGCGALNEVVEFIATLTIPETNVGGYINTGWDLVANTIGAVIAAVMIRLGGCKPQRQ